MQFEKLHVIVNPAAGQDEPVLNALNDAFRDAPLEWDISLTQKFGDGAKLAKQAIDDGADLIAVYGGDGTIGDVVNGMHPTDVPLAVLSGGTGNGVADAMGIPDDLLESTRYITNGDNMIRKIDLGQVNDRLFILRVDAGRIVEVVEDLERKDKDEWGIFTYYYAMGKSFVDGQNYRFTLTTDGDAQEREGAVFVLLNMSRRNNPNVDVETNNQPDDGVFNMFLFESGFNTVLQGATAFAKIKKTEEIFEEFTGTHIRLDCAEKLTVLADGEPVGETPVDIEVVPGALSLLVPRIT